MSKPEFSVDRIVARMKEAAARKRPLSDAASTEVVTSAAFRSQRGSSGSLSELDLRPIQLQPRFQPSGDARYHVEDLLKYHDSAFIQNAYRAILKRGPDAIGYRTFLDSLRSARLNKIDILARLRYSAEGRSKQVEVEGLWLPATIRRAYRVPVIGYLLNLLVGVARLPTLIRSHQQFEAHILAQQETIVENLNHLNRSLLSHAEEVSRALKSQVDANNAFSQRLQALAQEYQARLDEFRNLSNSQMEAVAQQLSESTARWQEEFAAFEKRRKRWELIIQFKELQLKEADSSQRALLDGQRAEIDVQRDELVLKTREVRQELAHVFAKQQEVSTELVLQGERLAVVLAEARKRLSATPFDDEQLRTLAREEDHALDAFYAAFDEQFRGSRDEIKQRLRAYLPRIAAAGIGSESMRLLDVGSGRGEWLELLKEERLHARGVDSNRILVDWCRNRGLDVAEQDLIKHLTQLPDASLGAVTGFHIIEHLTIETLVEFLNQTIRVLKSGGMVIFETPNPQNVLVGSCNFYFDPTHRNPLPSQVTRFLLESRGFDRVEVLNLNPSDDMPVDEDTELARRFNKYFYGPMDYAVIGFRT